jgi:hypothetical protein
MSGLHRGHQFNARSAVSAMGAKSAKGGGAKMEDGGWTGVVGPESPESNI